MKNLLKKGQKIYVVPEDIKGALSSQIKKITKNFIELEVKENDLPYYKESDKIEMFAVVDDGMIYFKPEVSSKEENTLKVNLGEEYDILQRREYTRIEREKEFTLKDTNKEYVCRCIDISAGGMKFTIDADLDVEKDYQVEFSFESNIPIQCYFKPIRAGKQKDSKSVVSGRFIALKNIDKIAIVQFCFKKQIENTNK
jgi:c-di-GMP-binding flagellar brake protein YcgR